jgi:hypothetical protein
MMTDAIVICVGALVGGIAGGISGWVVTRRRADFGYQHPEAVDVIKLDGSDEIDGIAQRWATDQGIPDASDLVSRKLRLASHLQSRRQRGARWHT